MALDADEVLDLLPLARRAVRVAAEERLEELLWLLSDRTVFALADAVEELVANGDPNNVPMSCGKEPE